MDILRITARWTGFSGAPGYSNFHFTTDGGFWDGGFLTPDAEVAANGAAERVISAFSGTRSIFPSEVSIGIESEAEILDSDTGEIQGVVAIEDPPSTVGQATGGYSAVSGAVVNWRTNDYRFGRRIRGRTFLVPLAGSTYQSDGTLTSDALDGLRGFGNTIVNGSGSADFGVWSRPRAGAGGVFATAVGASVPDMAAVLRSRRD